MSSNFFAMVSRMKYINRWGLMNNTKYENLSSHSLEVAMFAHALAVIANKRCGEHLNADRAAVLGLYHDAGEIITGDMPTPIKYFNPEIKKAYKDIERIAENKLLSLLPEDLQCDFSSILTVSEEDRELERYVKAADKLSALVKCIEEVRMGNNEFEKALNSTKESLDRMNIPALKIFREEFLPAFYLTLDESADEDN